MEQIKKLCPLPLLLNAVSKVHCMGSKCNLYTDDLKASDCNCLAYPKYHYTYYPDGAITFSLFSRHGEGYTGK
jgi:hypothetical protein